MTAEQSRLQRSRTAAQRPRVMRDTSRPPGPGISTSLTLHRFTWTECHNNSDVIAGRSGLGSGVHRSTTGTCLYIYEPQSRLWLDMIIAQNDAHNFDAALNNNGLQPVGPRSVEALQRTDVDSADYDLLLVEPWSVQRSHNCVGTTRTSIC